MTARFPCPRSPPTVLAITCQPTDETSRSSVTAARPSRNDIVARLRQFPIRRGPERVQDVSEWTLKHVKDIVEEINLFDPDVNVILLDEPVPIPSEDELLDMYASTNCLTIYADGSVLPSRNNSVEAH